MTGVLVADAVLASARGDDALTDTSELVAARRSAVLLIGYARVSTDEQDLTAQRDALATLGVTADGIYVDHGLDGSNRGRPGLREGLAACRWRGHLVVTKPDRVARSLPMRA
jgi:Resolvase, N terminal domain